jgi:hypothetical protein
VALTTPIPQILLALDGLVDFTLIKSGKTPQPGRVAAPKSDPAEASKALASFLRGMARKQEA